MNRFLAALRVLSLLLGVEVLLLLLLLTGPALLAEDRVGETLASAEAWLPIVRHDPTPTAVPTPPPPSSPYAARLIITPTGGINASTFDRDSFILRNEATNEQRIVQVRIDLSTAVFPNMVFDPFGQGGDTLAKDLSVDEKGGTGFLGHRFEGEHGGGFDVLVLEFNFFDPREEFRFSVDVDPNSIRGVGAPGPNEAGSVSGLELLGSTVTVVFEDGKTLTNEAFHLPGSESGSQAVLLEGLPPAPDLAVQGVAAPPATLSEAQQTAVVTGPPWQPATLLVLEGGLFLDGVPGGGFDVEPYDANSLLAVQAFNLQTGANGRATAPVVLSKQMPQAGINHLVAAFDNFYGANGGAGAPVIIKLE